MEETIVLEGPASTVVIGLKSHRWMCRKVSLEVDGLTLKNEKVILQKWLHFGDFSYRWWLCKVRMLGMVFVPWNSFWNLVNSLQSLAPSGNRQVDDGAGHGVPGGLLSEREMGRRNGQSCCSSWERKANSGPGDMRFCVFFPGSNMKQWPVTHIDGIWRWTHGSRCSQDGTRMVVI